MTYLLRAAIIGFLSALASTALAQGPGNDREIRERVIYRDGSHLFVAPENGKLKSAANGIPSNGAWRLAGDPADRLGAGSLDIRTLNPDSPAATTAEQPTTMSEDKDEAGGPDDRTSLDYIALGLLIFIAVWAIAYRRDAGWETGGPSAKDRAEALDARLTYMDQRLADVERRVRREAA